MTDTDQKSDDKFWPDELFEQSEIIRKKFKEECRLLRKQTNGENTSTIENKQLI